MSIAWRPDQMQGLHAFQNDGLSKKNLGLCVSECVCVCVCVSVCLCAGGGTDNVDMVVGIC